MNRSTASTRPCRGEGSGPAHDGSAVGPPGYAKRVSQVLAAAQVAGRPAPALSARVRVRFDEASGEGYAMRGPAEQIAAEVRAFADAGATMLVLAFGVTDPAGVVAAAERFAREVAPLV